MYSVCCIYIYIYVYTAPLLSNFDSLVHCNTYTSSDCIPHNTIADLAHAWNPIESNRVRNLTNKIGSTWIDFFVWSFATYRCKPIVFAEMSCRSRSPHKQTLGLSFCFEDRPRKVRHTNTKRKLASDSRPAPKGTGPSKTTCHIVLSTSPRSKRSNAKSKQCADTKHSSSESIFESRSDTQVQIHFAKSIDLDSDFLIKRAV